MFKLKAICLLCVSLSSISIYAEEKEPTFISKQEALKLSSLSNSQTGRKQHFPKKSSFRQFTGRVLGSHVRLRTHPDVDSAIVRELGKDDLIVVTGEKEDFYEIAAPADIKAYIFRSFVLDNTVEGNRVNVRLAPDLDAPIIGHLNTGDRIQGKVADRNSKWLEIVPPSNTKFYVAKDFIEYAGGPDLKEVRDQRKSELAQLTDAALYTSDAEMRKAFPEIDFDHISSKFQRIIREYQDFPEEVQKATAKLTALQEAYLQKKLAFLEQKTELLSNRLEETAPPEQEHLQEKTIVDSSIATQIKQSFSSTTKMKMWEPVEQALFASWKSMNHANTIDEFYQDQKMHATTISGILEAYAEPIKKKPGDYIIKYRDVPIAFVYSTQLNLEDYLGKKVNLVVSERPNNNFAWPAYYVHEVTY